jgi:hypothetical protein
MHLPEVPDALSASEPEQKTDQKKEHDRDEQVMSASRPGVQASFRVIPIKLRTSAPLKTYEDVLRSALRGWEIKGPGQSGWQCSRGNDRLVDEGDRVRAKNGSPAEVEACLPSHARRIGRAWRSAAAKASNGT